MKHLTAALIAVVVALTLAAPRLSEAQSISTSEREALVARHVERGGRAGDLDAIIRLTNEAGAKGLPVAPLTNKIREGLAKRADLTRIEAVVQQMAAQLETADRIVREAAPASATLATREASVTLLAEAIGAGVTVDEVRELGRQAQQPPGAPPMSADSLASAARGLSLIKDAKLSVADGTAVVAEAARRGFRARDMLDLGREIKRRERDYQTGRASLRTLRDAIARGERPEQLLRDSRSENVERPAAARPEPAVERPERPTRPEPPARPERPVRPEIPERPGTGRDGG